MWSSDIVGNFLVILVKLDVVMVLVIIEYGLYMNNSDLYFIVFFSDVFVIFVYSFDVYVELSVSFNVNV